MNAPFAQPLAGTLVATPGSPGRALRSSRRELAPLLGRGRPVRELPALLSAAYALCGGAHRLAASAAVWAAQRQEPWRASPREQEALRLDTLREHLRRIALDWPRVLTWPGATPTPTWLAGCPLLRDGRLSDAGLDWIERELLGRPAGGWLRLWDESGDDFLDAWAHAGPTAAARWLNVAQRQLRPLALAVRAVPVPAEVEHAQVLARHLREQPGFALQPTWRDQPAETGPWTRRAGCGEAVPASAVPLARRLAARLAEIARLALPQGGDVLELGAMPVGDREGLAWCEMARGLLVHWVRLAPASAVPEATVERVRVLAPTEWNFHPRGALAQLIGSLPADVPQPVVELAAAAFDPCVDLRVERQRRDQEPGCTR